MPLQLTTSRSGFLNGIIEVNKTDSPGLRFAEPPSLRLRRKEGGEKKKENPLYARSGERDDERSDVGVSRYAMRLLL
jgi:hypothetical protein